jgi:hypothetical protein
MADTGGHSLDLAASEGEPTAVGDLAPDPASPPPSRWGEEIDLASSEGEPSDAGSFRIATLRQPWEHPDNSLDLAAAAGEGEPTDKSEPPGDSPSPDHSREVAKFLLWIFGVCIFLIIALSFTTALTKPDSLEVVLGFFGTIVAALGTLLGGVVAFYFARR